MSDGNFNRNLLPYNSYQSGFRAGKARMKQHALEAFQVTIKKHFSQTLSEEVQKEVFQSYLQELNKNNT